VNVIRTFLLALVFGCASDPTQILVVVDAEPQLEGELDSVRVRVEGEQRAVTLDMFRLPLVVPVNRGGDSPAGIRAVAEGLRGDVGRVTTSGTADFVAGEARVMHLVLAAGCLDALDVCEEPGETCTQQGCASEDRGPLPRWTGRPPRVENTDAGVLPADAGTREDAGARDAGPDAGPFEGDAGPDAGPFEGDAGPDAGASAGDAGPDAGASAGDAGSCVPCDECSCDDGCCAISCDDECDVACASDTTCVVDAEDGSNISLTCDRGSCTLEARRSSNVSASCSTQSECVVDCRDTSNCEVRCSGTAECLLDCRGASDGNCRFTSCPGGPTSCGDGVSVCRRACP